MSVLHDQRLDLIHALGYIRAFNRRSDFRQQRSARLRLNRGNFCSRVGAINYSQLGQRQRSSVGLSFYAGNRVGGVSAFSVMGYAARLLGHLTP